ncbi:hypothetical protein BRE01_62500 [Brevibacillus reuszeri]|uniref:CxxH/CxxC protein n=1 Tax=Brevibacillus reuszeri TaxID=54915 RepID=A0ABQ0TX96_9BACL|nr:hypothetical protein [Brevibacillus reuszeri]GED72548.1 hypothetical protein BRE01_62500 [Brevibacillus reuszeri]
MNIFEIDWVCKCGSKETSSQMVSEYELKKGFKAYTYCSECGEEKETEVS